MAIYFVSLVQNVARAVMVHWEFAKFLKRMEALDALFQCAFPQVMLR